MTPKPWYTTKRFYATAVTLILVLVHCWRTKSWDVELISAAASAVASTIFTVDGSAPMSLHSKKWIRRRETADNARGKTRPVEPRRDRLTSD